MIPQLSKQLNELDSTFQLPEGPYTFEYERRARDIMEAAYTEYTKSSSPIQDQPPAVVPSCSSTTPPGAIDGAVQEEPDLEGTGAQGDAIIDITPSVDTERVSGRDVDGSEVVVDNKQPKIP